MKSEEAFSVLLHMDTLEYFMSNQTAWLKRIVVLEDNAIVPYCMCIMVIWNHCWEHCISKSNSVRPLHTEENTLTAKLKTAQDRQTQLSYTGLVWTFFHLFYQTWELLSAIVRPTCREQEALIELLLDKAETAYWSNAPTVHVRIDLTMSLAYRKGRHV